MKLANKVRLAPDRKQNMDLFRFAGTNRFAWNQSKDFYDKFWEKKHEYAKLSDLMKNLQDMKHNNPDYAWLNDVPEAVTKQAMKDLLKAYSKFYKERKKHPDPKNPDRFKPKFKKKGKCQESFYQRTDNIRKTDDTHIKITGIKKPIKCSQLKGVDLPEHILNPRIMYDGKYWYLSYSFDVDEDDVVSEEDFRERLGIDLGIKDLAILSDGQHFENINKTPEMRRLRKRLKHIQKQISRKNEANVTVGRNGKKVYHKTNNIRKFEQQERLLYRRISSIQKTYMYEVIGAVLKTKARSIVLEDLNVKGMMQNPHLARAVQEQNLYKFRQILTYKCQKNGIRLFLADRWYPSSKTCSCCGHVKKDLKLHDRTYVCENCGNIMDRDENAAKCLELCPDEWMTEVDFNAA